LRTVVGEEGGQRYLIHDRDKIFANHLDDSIMALGIEVLQSPIASPKANSICERVIDGGPDAICSGVDDGHGVGVVFGDKEERLVFVEDHLVGIALQLDPLNNSGSGRIDVENDNLSIALARDIGRRVALDCNAVGILTSWRSGRLLVGL